MYDNICQNFNPNQISKQSFTDSYEVSRFFLIKQWKSTPVQQPS